MKKIIIMSAMIFATSLLASCEKSARDLKLSELNLPENEQLLLEQLTPEERDLLGSYVYENNSHLDYTVKIGDAIDKHKKRKEDMQKMRDAIK